MTLPPSGLLSVVFAAALTTAAAAPAPTPAPNRFAGDWGGEHVAMTIGDEGATLEFDCAAGSIDVPFAADAAGRFDLKGSFWRVTPVERVDAAPPRQPARWKGWTDGKAMTLQGTLVSDGSDLGTFTLERGRIPQLRRCA